ncbi:MAG: YIP1 family protein [Nanoarchaeota archaeon]
MITIFGKTANSLYLNPLKTIRKLNGKTVWDFVTPLLIGGILLGLGNELKNIRSAAYYGLSLSQGISFLIGSIIITILSFIFILYIIPLLVYKMEFMFIKEGSLKRLAYVMSLLAPLYASGILVRILLDIFLPEHAIFRFIALCVPAFVNTYAFGILYISMKEYYRIDKLKALMVTALPWLFMLIYYLI